MEHLVNQGLEVGEADETQLATASPNEFPDGIPLEEHTNDKAKAVDAKAPAADDIVDLVKKIENLAKHI